jgi:glycine dehydrogenase subunit 1
MVTVFLSLHGKQGLRELALQNLAKAGYAQERFKKAGARVRFSGPFFNEMVITGLPARKDAADRLAAAKIVGGFDLGREYPELAGDQLLCFTETATREKIDQLVEILTS